MRLNILCFVAGAWWLQQQPALPDAGWAWAFAAVGLAATAVRSGSAAQRLACEALVKAACVALGFSWAAWCAQQRLADALPAALHWLTSVGKPLLIGLPLLALLLALTGYFATLWAWRLYVRCAWQSRRRRRLRARASGPNHIRNRQD